MKAIDVSDLRKTFRIRMPAKGLRQTAASLFFPRYREAEAVCGLSFSLEPGERVAFVGPNGAGKSTTIKILSGILQPTSGAVQILGLTPWADRRVLSYRIGAVFGQRSQLWQHLPASDSFELLACAYEIPPDIFKARIGKLREVFALGPLLEKPVRQLSLGERMRCEIAASLLHKPDILFLDEPTVGLDVTAKAAIRDLIRTASTEDGATVLLTSHDTGDMERVCNRVIVIDHGALVVDQGVSDLRARYIGRKIVTLETEETDIAIGGAGIQILERAPHRVSLSVDTTLRRVESVVQDAMSKSPLRDLTVEDPPMEDIIKAIYAKGRAAA